MVKKGSKKTASKKKKQQGMTVGEIKKKLGLLKTERAKLSYLSQISERPGLLKPKTREAMHKVFEDLLNTKAKKELLDKHIEEDLLGEVEELSEELGKKAQERVLDVYIREGKLDDAERLARKIGDKEKLAGVYEKEGKVMEAMALRKKLKGKYKKRK